MKKIKISLAWQIVIALILGVLLGSFLHYSPEYRDALVNNVLTPLGSIFITLIKMIVIPLVVSMLILGTKNLIRQTVFLLYSLQHQEVVFK